VPTLPAAIAHDCEHTDNDGEAAAPSIPPSKKGEREREREREGGRKRAQERRCDRKQLRLTLPCLN
jgi:hypothetical protein